MPHHQSRQQQRPDGGNGFPPGVGMGAVGFGGRMDRQQQHHHHPHPEGMMVPQGVHPPPPHHPHAMQPWMQGGGGPASYHPGNMNQPHGGRTVFPPNHGGIHHVPMPKTFSYDSTSSANSLSPKHDYSSSQTSKLAQSSSFESARHQAAIALLEGSRIRKASAGADHDDPSVSTERSRPIKKRKPQTEQNSTSYGDAPHVSPMSHVSTRSEGATPGGGGGERAGTPRVVHSGCTSMASSVHSDEADTKHDEEAGGSATREDGQDAGGAGSTPSSAVQTPTKADSKKKPGTPPPMKHVVIPHFPSVLHNVLTKSEHAGKVVQWMPHGRAWKIVRWEALRRDVLPKYFPPLREAEQSNTSSPGTPPGSSSAGGGAGSIDTFLWHLSAWGFEEIADGRDAGAYAHPLFLQDDPELCSRMSFSFKPQLKDDDAAVGAASHSTPNPAISGTTKKGAPSDSHSILRVPSLATPSTDGRSMASADRNIAEHPPSPPGFGGGSRNWGGTGTAGSNNKSIFVNYERGDRSHNNSSMMMLSGPGAFRSQNMPPYSPIRIRSTRGGSRMASLVTRPSMPESLSGSSTKPRTSGFPVSNRGRRPASLVTHRSMDGDSLSAETPLKMLAAATTATASAVADRTTTTSSPITGRGSSSPTAAKQEKEQQPPPPRPGSPPQQPKLREPPQRQASDASSSSSASVTPESAPRPVLKRRLPLAAARSAGLDKKVNNDDDDDDDSHETSDDENHENDASDDHQEIKPTLSNSSSSSTESGSSSSVVGGDSRGVVVKQTEAV